MQKQVRHLEAKRMAVHFPRLSCFEYISKICPKKRSSLSLNTIYDQSPKSFKNPCQRVSIFKKKTKTENKCLFSNSPWGGVSTLQGSTQTKLVKFYRIYRIPYMVRTWPKVRAKQFPFSKRRTNNFPFQTVREEGSQLYWTAHKPNWSPTSSLFSQEYIFCLHLVFTWHTIQPYNNFQIVNYKSTPKTGSPKIKVLYTLWSWTGTVRQEWLDGLLTKNGGWDLVGILGHCGHW